MVSTRQSLRSEAIGLIRAAADHLRSEKMVLADHADCDYFRSLYRTPRNDPPPLPSTPHPAPIEKKPAVQAETVLPLSPAAPAEPPAPKNIEVEPAQPLPPKDVSLNDVRKLMSRIFPEMNFPVEIPSDAKARLAAGRWKTKNLAAPLSILAFHEQPMQHQFLMNLAAALDTVFNDAKLIQAEEIETENQWEAFLSAPGLKLAVICDYALWQMPRLLQYYRENPNRSEKFLQNIPLLLLPDLTLYFKDSSLKRSLWKALCQKIGSL